MKTRWTIWNHPGVNVFKKLWTLPKNVFENSWTMLSHVGKNQPTNQATNQHQRSNINRVFPWSSHLTWTASMLALDDTGTPAWQRAEFFRVGHHGGYFIKTETHVFIRKPQVFIGFLGFNPKLVWNSDVQHCSAIHSGNGMLDSVPRTKIKPFAWEPLILSTKYTASSLTAPWGTRMGGSTRTCRG